MSAHVSVPTNSVSQVIGVGKLICFEIIHINDNENVWNRWELDGNHMRRVFKTHPFHKECRQIFDSQIPRMLSKLMNALNRPPI